MVFKGISKELSAARLSGTWSTHSAKSPPRQLFCSPQPSPLWLHNHSHVFYIMFFVLLGFSTDRKHAREVSSILFFSGQPPCTHPQRTPCHVPCFTCIFYCHLEAPFSSQQYFCIFLPHFSSEWATYTDTCSQGVSRPSVTTLSKRPAGSTGRKHPSTSTSWLMELHDSHKHSGKL